MTLRIALIAGTYKPEHCGVAHYTARLRDELKKQNVESVVLTTHTAAAEVNDSSVISSSSNYKSIISIRVPASPCPRVSLNDKFSTEPDIRGAVDDWRFANLMSLVQAVHATKADILHIQHAAGTYGFERAIFLLPLLLKATGYRKLIVTTVHEYGWWEWLPLGIPPQFVEWLKMWGQKRGWWDREDGFLLSLSDAIITTNAEAEGVIHKRLPQLIERVVHVPIAANVDVAPIDKTTARLQLRQRCNFALDTIAIVFFGFLHPVKGIETLLPAFKQVLTTHPQARLLLVGGVESLALRGEEAKRYWEKLHALVAELNLSEMVHFTGYLDAETASQYLSGCDIGVLPFNHGLTMKSGSLLALLAHGLPVIGTSHNTPLPDGHPVQLVQSRNIEALADALGQLLNETDKCNYLGDVGRAFIQNITWFNIARSHINIYTR